jgi:predicted alpha/beta-hydrolase family hydrolase
VVDAPTSLGPARLHIWTPQPGRVAGRLVLGHGAGGGIGAPDLTAVRIAVVAAGWQVVLVEQPWRVAGKRVAPLPPRLDIGWIAALEALPPLPRPHRSTGELPLVLGGRSAGARVACRTALELGATAVCCLAFPLHPPGRPDRSRAPELAGAGVPVFVVQGSRDAFGGPDDLSALGLAGVEVVEVPGDHSLARPVAVPRAVAAAVVGRLPGWSEE